MLNFREKRNAKMLLKMQTSREKSAKTSNAELSEQKILQVFLRSQVFNCCSYKTYGFRGSSFRENNFAENSSPK